MGENSDAQPTMAVAMGAVDVHVEGGPDDDLDDVREQFDHALERALEGADDLSDLHL